MAVAPSFTNFEMLTDPYEVSGKMYVRVRNPKTGTERQVRWYSNEPKSKSPAVNKFDRTQKEVLGFEKDYITIFKGDTYAHLDWFRASIARYAKWWGWYIISTDEIPEDLPDGLETIRLPWSAVGNDNGELKPEGVIQKEIEALIYDAGVSEYVGKIGERLELTLTVVKAIELDNDYGHSIVHVMEDEVGNIFVWTTSAKSWAEGSIKKLRGTVKDHRTYKNNKQTILTRCLEVK